MKKTSRTSAPKKRVGAKKVAGTAKTKKFGGKTYTKTSCSATVTDARKKAASIKKAGKLARVVKNIGGRGACVYTRNT